MPLPEKRPGEGHEKFIARCMGADVMVREYPDAEQRRAVCEAQWKGSTRMSSESTQQPDYLTFRCPLTVEAADDGEKGHKMPRFRMVAYTGGTMRIAGFPHPVVVDLARIIHEAA